MKKRSLTQELSEEFDMLKAEVREEDKGVLALKFSFGFHPNANIRGILLIFENVSRSQRQAFEDRMLATGLLAAAKMALISTDGLDRKMRVLLLPVDSWLAFYGKGAREKRERLAVALEDALEVAFARQWKTRIERGSGCIIPVAVNNPPDVWKRLVCVPTSGYDIRSSLPPLLLAPERDIIQAYKEMERRVGEMKERRKKEGEKEKYVVVFSVYFAVEGKPFTPRLGCDLYDYEKTFNVEQQLLATGLVSMVSLVGAIQREKLGWGCSGYPILFRAVVNASDEAEASDVPYLLFRDIWFAFNQANDSHATDMALGNEFRVLGNHYICRPVVRLADTRELDIHVMEACGPFKHYCPPTDLEMRVILFIDLGLMECARFLHMSRCVRQVSLCIRSLDEDFAERLESAGYFKAVRVKSERREDMNVEEMCISCILADGQTWESLSEEAEGVVGALRACLNDVYFVNSTSDESVEQQLSMVASSIARECPPEATYPIRPKATWPCRFSMIAYDD